MKYLLIKLLIIKKTSEIKKLCLIILMMYFKNSKYKFGYLHEKIKKE